MRAPRPAQPTVPTGASGAAHRLRDHLVVLAVLCAITFAAYSNSFRCGFVFDNRGLVLQDPRVHDVSANNLELIFDHTYNWPRAEHGLYRPFTTLTYLFNFAILGNGERPAGYHWFNLLLQIANVFLVYFVALRILSRQIVAAFAAGLWAVHPVATEAVTNIIGRSDLLVAAAVLGGLLLYMRSAEAKGWRRAPWLFGLALITLLGALSKESAVVIAGVILLYEIAQDRLRRRTLAIMYGLLAVALPIGAMLYQRSVVLANSAAPEFHYLDNPLSGASILNSKLTAITLLVRYLRLFTWPATLSSNYSYHQIAVAHGGAADWLFAAAVVAIVAVALLQWRLRPAVFFFAAFALVCLLPVSNLLFPIGAMMADRFLYLPGEGLAAIAATGIFAIAERMRMRSLAPVILSLAIVGLGLRTWARNRDWRDDLSFWSAAVKSAPNSAESHRGYAAALYESDATHANLPAVIAEAERALTIVDGLPDRLNSTAMYSDAGKYYEEEGDRLVANPGTANLPNATSTQEFQNSLRVLLRGVAIDHAVNEAYIEQEAARGRPASEIAPQGLPQLYEYLAVTHLRLNEPENAIQAARYARMLAPLSAETHMTLVWVLANVNRPADAAVALIEEFLATGNPAPLAQLQAIYRSGLDKTGCAMRAGAAGPALNPACELVRTELCSASAELAQIYEWNRRPDLANEAESRALASFGCRTDELRKP